MGASQRGRQDLCENRKSQNPEDMEEPIDTRKMTVEEYRRFLRNLGVNEDRFSDDQIATLQRFINRLCEIIADEIINGNLSYVQFQENRD